MGGGMGWADKSDHNLCPSVLTSTTAVLFRTIIKEAHKLVCTKGLPKDTNKVCASWENGGLMEVLCVLS